MHKGKRILFILPTLEGGGAEKVVLALAGAFLRSAGWTPALVLTTDRAGAHDAHIPAGLEVIRLKAAHVRRSLPALVRLIRRLRPDVIFAALDHLNFALGLIAPLLPKGTRLVLRATSLRVLERPVQRRLLAWAFGRADLVIFQSNAMQEQLGAGLRLSRQMPFAIMGNPLDFGTITQLAHEPASICEWPDGTQTRLVAAGRLSRTKGFDLLISAMVNLPDSVSLVILGDGEAAADLRDQITRLGLTDRVILAGFHDNPYAWFARAHAFVLSSRVEGYPNVVLEALACSCPVIATPLPGLANGVGCRLSRAISTPALTDAITDFLRDPHVADPRVLHMDHDLERLRQRYERLFDSLLTESPAHAIDLYS